MISSIEPCGRLPPQQSNEEKRSVSSQVNHSAEECDDRTSFSKRPPVTSLAYYFLHSLLLLSPAVSETGVRHCRLVISGSPPCVSLDPGYRIALFNAPWNVTSAPGFISSPRLSMKHLEPSLGNIFPSSNPLLSRKKELVAELRLAICPWNEYCINQYMHAQSQSAGSLYCHLPFVDTAASILCQVKIGFFLPNVPATPRRQNWRDENNNHQSKKIMYCLNS